MTRRFFPLLLLLSVLGYLWWVRGPALRPLAPPSTTAPTAPSSPLPIRPPPASDPLAGLVGEGLNAANGSVERDLAIVDELLGAWRSNFPGLGNPVGENREITRALTGRNRLRLVLVPPDHPAINAAGELTDRWGTPLVFHQISGTHMELRSAGPDRRPYTADDVVWNPVEPPAVTSP